MKKVSRALLVGMLAAPIAAWGQAPAPAGGGVSPTPDTVKQPAPIVLHYDKTALATVAKELARQSGRPVLMDGTVRGRTPVTLSGEAADLEAALARVTTSLGLSWRKVYLPPAPARDGAEAMWTGEQVRAAAAAVESLERTGVIVEEPGRGRATLFMRSVPAAADFEGKVRVTWPQMKPHYLITHPRARAPRREAVATRRPPGEVTAEEFAALERERVAMFLRMPREERATAMSQAMDFMLQADPAVMQEMMQSGMQAWMESMQRMTPDQRRQMLQHQMEMMQRVPPEVWQDLFTIFKSQ